ncbi:MAG: MATE family efflux transporter [Armatimonadetes bacterium]|nr:MATE family efflux transporter [Armatimonadota bacterium]MDW8121889.1 MATE family efflux transporter [Armatimonadota bacterium]
MEDHPDHPRSDRNAHQSLAVGAPIGRAVGLLTVPTLIAQVVQTFGWLGEIYFVSGLGDEATAAVGAVGQLGMFLMALMMMVSTSTTTLTAQRWGADDKVGAQAVVAAALQQALLVGLLVWIIWPVRHWLWAFFRLSETVAHNADVYLLASLFAGLPLSLSFAYMALFRGIGDMVSPLISVLLAVGSHLLLVFPFVHLWGLWGAGAALCLSRLLSLLFLLLRLRTSPLSVPLGSLRTVDRSVHAALLQLGLPAAIGSLSMTLAGAVYYAIISRVPDPVVAQAALTTGMRVEALAFMPGIAFAITAQTLVGQNVGAGQWERARQAAWQATGYAVGVMSAIGAIFFIFSEPIANLFTNHPPTAAAIASYLRINALSEPFLAVAMSLGGALRGAGDTFSPALISVFSLWIARMPATYWLCAVAKKDLPFAWWVMALSTALSGVLTAAVFQAKDKKARGWRPLPIGHPQS